MSLAHERARAAAGGYPAAATEQSDVQQPRTGRKFDGDGVRDLEVDAVGGSSSHSAVSHAVIRWIAGR